MSKKEKNSLERKEGFALWITGLPASGKSTLAQKLKEKLELAGVKVEILESDVIRKKLFPKSTYSLYERKAFYSALLSLGKDRVKKGENVIFDATCNRRVFREKARSEIKNFMEVYVKCSLEECKRRDPKGIYRMADEGIAKTVPGAQEPYEEPLFPEVVVETEKVSPEEGVEEVFLKVKKLFLERR